MPELVYKVKFEVDSSNLEKITSGIDPSSSKQVQDLEKSYNDLKNKFEELKNSFKGGSGSGGAVGGASAGFLDLMQNVKTTTSEVRKNTSSFKKSIVVNDQTTDSFINQAEALSDGSVQLQRLRDELEQAAAQETLTDKQTEQLNNTINSLANVQKTAVSASKNFKDGLRVVEHQSGTMNKAFAGSNQLLFSFSDLVQDSTQFSQGFSQGMRAIGNNVGFTAELFANLTNNVQRHNKLVADGTLKNEKQITTFEALRNSIKGAGGALILINGLVMATTLVFQGLDRRLKETRESAKAQGEAFSEVAKTFAQIDTGIPDPFGLRARQVEIKILSDQVGLTVDELSEQLATAFEETGKMNKFQAFMAEKLLPTVLNIKAAFDEETAAQLIALEANEELRKEIEKQKQVQEAYQKLLQQNEPLRNYVNLTKDLSLFVAEARTGMDLSTQSIEDLDQKTKDQITTLTSKNELNEEEIGLLFQLLDIQKRINSEKIKEIDIENQLKSISDNESVIKQNIALMQEESSFNRIAIERRIRDSQIESNFESEKSKIKKDLLAENISEEQAATRLEAIESLKRTKLRQSELTEQKQIEQERRDVISSSLDMAANFVGAFGALKQQEIQNELQAAKARGASADELDRINRKKFRAEKRAQIASAIINTASAVVEALPNQGLAIATAALGAIQLATIRKTKYGGGGSTSSVSPPKAEGGSFIEVTGEESLPLRGSLEDRSTITQSKFMPTASQFQQQKMEVVVVNTFNEETVASVARKGSNGIRTSQIGV